MLIKICNKITSKRKEKFKLNDLYFLRFCFCLRQKKKNNKNKNCLIN